MASGSAGYSTRGDISGKKGSTKTPRPGKLLRSSIRQPKANLAQTTTIIGSQRFNAGGPAKGAVTMGKPPVPKPNIRGK